MPFSEAFDATLDLEGGYSDHEADSGGKTRFGITEAVAREHGYTGEMKDLPREVAMEIARRSYWDALSLDSIDALDQHTAQRLFDMAYNVGTYRAGEFFQRILNVLNKGGTLYADITVDGKIGPRTVDAFRRYLAHRGRDGALVMRRALNALLGAFYIELAERRQKDEAFVYGWLSRRLWMT